jgi:hypothetical protein
MKNTFKKIFAALAATAICAVPMTGAMTASASDISGLRASAQIYRGDLAEILINGESIGRVEVGDIVPLVSASIVGYSAYDDPGDWCGTPYPGKRPSLKRKGQLVSEKLVAVLNKATIRVRGTRVSASHFVSQKGSNGTIIVRNPLTNPPMITVFDADGNIIYNGTEDGYYGGIIGVVGGIGGINIGSKVGIAEALNKDSIKDKVEFLTLTRV